MTLTFLDGPMGSELERRGVALPAPAWTAAALAEAPDVVAAIHRDWADAGADVHTTATFRTRERNLAGTPWAGRADELAATAVALCRRGAGAGATIAGSIAPLEDCYRPDLTPDDDTLAAEHSHLARTLADAECDLLLVETMPSLGELCAATRAAVATGLPTWSAITLGPAGDFFDASQVADALRAAADLGAAAFLINCTPPDLISASLAALTRTLPQAPIPLGAYGNDLFDGHMGWTAERYAAEARRWVDSGATIVGTCCGTTPAHLLALRAALESPA